MPEDVENVEGEEQEQQESSSDATQNTEHMIPKSRFDEVNERAKKAEAALAKAEKEREKAEREALAEQGKYKDLYEQAQAKLGELEPKAKEADALRAAIAESNQTRIEQLPEQYRALVPEYDDPVKVRVWLDANASLLTGSGPAAPSLDGGAGGADRPDGSRTIKLTDEQKRAAKMAGMTEAEYIKYMLADQPIETDDELDRVLRS